MAAYYWEELHLGKRQALWTQTVSIHDDHKTEYVVQCVMRPVERDGQLLLVDQPRRGAGGSDQTLPGACHSRAIHSVIKTDLDLEHLPSGKFTTNDLILRLAQLAYNILRLMGQLA